MKVWDPLRKKKVALTPEEKVRQWCIGVLRDTMKVPEHMMMSEAAKLAKLANVKQLWLTHYSPSMLNPKEYMEDTKKIFRNTIFPKDGQHLEMKFED